MSHSDSESAQPVSFHDRRPWSQTKIAAFANYLTVVTDRKLFEFEADFRVCKNRETIIAEDEQRLKAGRPTLLPWRALQDSEADYYNELLIVLFQNIYNGTMPALLAEIRKRGLDVT